MQKIELSQEEAEVLRDVLLQRIGQMDMEILHTDSHSYKEMLKGRKTLLEQLLVKIGAVPMPA